MTTVSSILKCSFLTWPRIELCLGPQQHCSESYSATNFTSRSHFRRTVCHAETLHEVFYFALVYRTPYHLPFVFAKDLLNFSCCFADVVE